MIIVLKSSAQTHDYCYASGKDRSSSEQLAVDDCSRFGYSMTRPITPIAIQQLHIEPSIGEKTNAETARQCSLDH